MKPKKYKREFVRLRAEGNSYSVIAQELHISKSTCTEWERELKTEIDDLKREELRELSESYGIIREARIRRLGDTLRRIDDTLSGADLSQVDTVKLLDYQLRYTEALKSEASDLTPGLPAEMNEIRTADVVAALGDLLLRIRDGAVTTEQARQEATVLSSLLKATQADGRDAESAFTYEDYVKRLGDRAQQPYDF